MFFVILKSYIQEIYSLLLIFINYSFFHFHASFQENIYPKSVRGNLVFIHAIIFSYIFESAFFLKIYCIHPTKGLQILPYVYVAVMRMIKKEKVQFFSVKLLDLNTNETSTKFKTY